MNNLADIVVSECETHHIRQGKQFYQKIFDKVLKYHQPGLAPVVDSTGAYHIDLAGNPAYHTRYKKTFGYYHDVAAVESEDGWFHIDTAGNPVYKVRYRWCGNFQGGVCVVEGEKGFFHINTAGDRLYQQSFVYVGDFRDGIAVVQTSQGYRHIRQDGTFLHEHIFIDLDVFHKSYARAKDDRGWYHIDFLGKPIYQKRYAMVEPFYNGVARVEGFGGELLRIDESGSVLQQLRKSSVSPLQQLSADMVGYWKTQTIATAVELGVFECLPATVETIATTIKLSMPSTKRLMRALGELELVMLDEDSYSLTSKSEFLKKDHAYTLATAAKHWADDSYQVWTRLTEVLKSETEGYSQLFGKPIFEYLSQYPQKVLDYQCALTSYAKHDYSGIAKQLDLSRFNTVMDVAGGQGVLLQEILSLHSHLSGILLERPEVIAQVGCSRERIQALPFDLFKPWGKMADAIFLARILHDWNDERCLEILSHAKASLNNEGEIFVVEFDFRPDGFSGGLLDLNMLIQAGGKEREFDEYTDLARQVGLNFVDDIVHGHYRVMRFAVEK